MHVYVSSLIHEFCWSVHDLRRRLAIARHATGELGENVWSTRLPLDLKRRLYSVYILSIFLYDSET